MSFVFTSLYKGAKFIIHTAVFVADHFWEEHRSGLFTTIAILSALLLYTYNNNKRKRRQKWNEAGNGVVVLHGFGRGKTCPNFSPYVLKLETYLRMAGIKYIFDSEQPIGPKGLSPWITINGEDYADSQLAMEYLGKKFGRDLNSHLTEEQKGIARSFQIMADEHIFWGLVHWRFLKDPENRLFDLVPIPLFFRLWFPYFRNMLRKRLKSQGIGLHTDQEIEEIIKKDLQALSLYLGNKKFLMGDEPCEEDCAVFGMLSQFVWCSPGSVYAVLVQSEFRNLQNYCLRMKDKFWHDWDQCLL